jgi:hypothetical protein
LNRHCDRERSEREAIQRQKSDFWIASLEQILHGKVIMGPRFRGADERQSA